MKQFQGLVVVQGGLVNPTRMIRDVTFCLANLCTGTVCSYICVLNLKKNAHFDFFDDCMNGTCGFQYLQNG